MNAGNINSQREGKVCGLAVSSLILGIVAWAGAVALGILALSGIGTKFGFIPFLAAIAAAICGRKAISKIRETSEALTGRGMAVAGRILGYALIILVLVGLLLVVVIPNFLRSS